MAFDRDYLRASLAQAFEDMEIALDTNDDDLFDHAHAGIDGLLAVLRPGADDHMDA